MSRNKIIYERIVNGEIDCLKYDKEAKMIKYTFQDGTVVEFKSSEDEVTEERIRRDHENYNKLLDSIYEEEMKKLDSVPEVFRKLYAERLISTIVDARINHAINEHMIAEAVENNRYNILENAPFKVQMDLIKRGIIQPVIFFMDEINRAFPEVMQEIMNIILTKFLNDYKLPFWVFTMAARNPSTDSTDSKTTFSTNTMDSAQLDRFYVFYVNKSDEKSLEYMANKNIYDFDILSALANIPSQDNTSFEKEFLKDTPRSRESLADVYTKLKDLEKFTQFFTDGELKAIRKGDVFDIIAKAKFGNQTGAAIVGELRNLETMVRPADVLTGKSSKVADDVKERYGKQKTLRASMTRSAILKFVSDNIQTFQTGIKKFTEKYDLKTYTVKTSKYDKDSDLMMAEQLHDFINNVMIRENDKRDFVSKINKVYGLKVYSALAPLFSMELYKIILESEKISGMMN